MEITLDAIISFIGLFLSGGAGAFFTWKWQKRKAKAEAEKEEAEAKNAAMDAVKNMQEAYEKMFENVNKYLDDATIKVDGMRKERDYYYQRMEETQEKFDKFNRTVMDWKQNTDDTIDDLKRKVARNGRQIEMMRPFMCGKLDCNMRQHVVLSEDGTVKTKRPQKKAGTVVSGGTADAPEKPVDIEPLNSDEL